MLNKIATLVCAVAFGFAVYSPTADACPGHEDKATIAEKDKNKDDKKVADKKKTQKDKASKKKAKKTKKKEGKKVSRK